MIIKTRLEIVAFIEKCMYDLRRYPLTHLLGMILRYPIPYSVYDKI